MPTAPAVPSVTAGEAVADGKFKEGNTAGVATRFQPGNAASLKTGAYSAMVRARDRQRAAELAKAGIRQTLDEACTEMAREIEIRQGFRVTIAQQELIRRFQELAGLIGVLFDKLTDPLTATGKTKQALEPYKKLTELQAKIANLLGLPKFAQRALPDLPGGVGRDDYEPED